MPDIGGFQFDENAFRAAIQLVEDKLSGKIEELCETTVELAKEDSPIGWHKHRPLSDTHAPAGYVGGTNRKSITADVQNADGATKHFGEMPSAGGREGMPDKGDLGFRVYTQSGYGGWLELGTKRMAARPYIYTGFMRAVDGLKSDLEGAL
jgi:hypothetical protein